VCPVNVSEDCLTLNVWTPRLDQITGPLPVMVFIPGGRFEDGTAEVPLYNAEYLCNTSQVVVVNINYRLGALGFLVAKYAGLKGNIGFLDQQMAIHWIKNNIDAFGGDPDHVTLFGQSAGASSVLTHMIAPDSWDAFHKVIIESAPLSLSLPDLNDGQSLGDRFLKDAGCSDPLEQRECLRNLSIDDILNAQQKSQNFFNPLAALSIFMPWGPVVDGEVVPLQVIDAISQGKFKVVPSIVGTVLNEGSIFVSQALKSPMPPEEYRLAMMDMFRENGDWKQVLQNYPSDNSTDDRTLVATLMTDYLFVCANRNLSRYISYYQSQTPYADMIWHYSFDHILSFWQSWGANYTICKDVVCHGSELPFVFHSASKGVPPYIYAFTPEEEQLSQLMSHFWGNFANSGDPNEGPSSPSLSWPYYNATESIYMAFNTPSYLKANQLSSKCDFWDTIGYLLP